MSDPFNPESFPLHDAARDKKNLLVSQLSKTDPKSILLKDGDGRTPLHWAASSGNTEGLSILLKAIKENKSLSSKFDIDDEDNAGWTLLHIGSSTGNVDILDLIKPWGADADAKTNASQTGLHFAASKGHIDVVRKLLGKKGDEEDKEDGFNASSRIKDKLNQLPLHRAAAIGSLPIVHLLIAAKSPLNVADLSGGWTPLHHALAEGHGDVAVELVKAGADLEKEDEEGKKPLDVAADEKTRKYVQVELEKMKR